ncbi:MAG: hypothetical protein ACK2U9_07505, partial [Anaerolineae bacterium]
MIAIENRPITWLRLLAFGFGCLLTGTVAAQEATTPIQDPEFYTAPVGVPSTLGGPTQAGELTILREQHFMAAPVDATGSGVTLTPGDPTLDGQYAASIYFRTGPVIDNSRTPETQGSVT